MLFKWWFSAIEDFEQGKKKSWNPEDSNHLLPDSLTEAYVSASNHNLFSY